MTHQIEEIRRRLSVLETRLDITTSYPRVFNSLYEELDSRIKGIETALELKTTQPIEPEVTQEYIKSLFDLLVKFETKVGITGNKNPDAPEPREIRPLKYEVNFTKGINGNSIRTGSKLLIKIRGAKSVSCGLYKEGSLILANQSHNNDDDKNTETTNLLLKKRRLTRLGFQSNLDPGTYVLKTWFWVQETGEQGTYTDEFEIIP